MSEPLLEVKNLKTYFPIKGGIFSRTVGHVKAVDGVSFTINKGEVFGLVGESGSGKTTIGKTILRLVQKTEGEVKFKGHDVHSLSKKELRKHRPNMQLVFQDPFSSLNPRMRIGEALGEPMLAHGLATKENVREKVTEVLELCGLAPYHIDRYPHEFSGGQRQRIVIARAMVLNPEFIVADEPVAALDVSIQAQIINLFSELQEKKGLSYLFISHDLSVVEHLCTKIGIMYLGTIVETAPRDELFTNPLHPYTKALLSAVPIPDPTVKRERIILEGDIPSPANPPSGCRFHTRCPFATDICKQTVPEFRNVGEEHFVACHHV
ncbi:ABC transporter ATP-binding protein [Bacillus mobilis]|uniref:Peptide ABC transporter substrate-binding protein n=2 Tax=Bacillus cereus group TaxID=86661 RepID=A0A1C3Z8F0_BACCE|nr:MULTISPECIES: ABC transporter ATP-binding protein [Bacillus cereus group]MCU5593732.1 ABC transporter ATP-binding protein [Bacillus mobilis]MCU5737184.1 ABC transporter ATP-binding protein [Bacillus mobilis]MCU9560331.1 ABC transporter ATP-binding protein [Bacillus mobilis]OKA32912.1 peptide ABC transporter substrate-binding protein [Bacillus cereus]OKA34914.1 peptide ABC transporter substrate-binding protein [Bacillus cereus]